MGPGVAMECVEGRNGMHIFEDHFIVETINPDTGEVLPAGETGELVFTTITKEAFPLIRFRTGDISRIIPGFCLCGRTYSRIERISGRSDDMLIIRGVNVFPSQIESVLEAIEGIEPHYQLFVDRIDTLDTLEIQVEVSDTIFSDKIRELQSLEKRIVKDIRDYLGVASVVKLVEPKTLQRLGGKMHRVLDKRNI
jgi:phenylacetate-CoA ligase